MITKNGTLFVYHAFVTLHHAVLFIKSDRSKRGTQNISYITRTVGSYFFRRSVSQNIIATRLLDTFCLQFLFIFASTLYKREDIYTSAVSFVCAFTAISHSQVLGKSGHMLFDKTVNKAEECATDGWCFSYSPKQLKSPCF